jgi:HSP20 family protein
MSTLTKSPSRSLRTQRGSWLSPFERSLLSPFDRFFNSNVFDLGDGNKFGTIPSLNITEEKDQYRVDLAAPGLKKEDFKIDVDGNMITISCDKEEESKKTDGEEGQENYTRWEYDYSSFSRSLSLPEYADTANINAKYNEGILHITIPKKPEAIKQPPKQIKIQ